MSYYTGVTNNLDRRLEEHESGINPNCYTFSRRPLQLLYFETYQNIFEAINREKQIKGWGRKKKEALIKGDMNELVNLSKNRQKKQD